MFGRLALLLFSAALTLAAAELFVRASDGHPLLALRVPLYGPPKPEPSLAQLAASLPGAPGVDPSWIDAPPPLPNRRQPSAEMQRLHEVPVAPGELESERYRQWNSAFVEKTGCKAPDAPLARRPPPLIVFDAVDANPQPVYRQPLDATTPIGLVTNRFGWRGPPIDVDKSAGTVRLAFVGASTTIGAHHLPFSYPEYLVHWLNLWARAEKLPVRFEGINTGREGLASSSFAAIVRQELLPMEPDLVVYYEGANQFRFDNLVDIRVTPSSARAVTLLPAEVSQYTSGLRPYSALVRRFERAVEAAILGDGSEPEKPAYKLTWPPGVNEAEPDLSSRNLPLSLSFILSDLESIRSDLASVGSELAMSSFVWFVDEGLRIDAKHAGMHAQLNIRWWPYRYRDMRRMADFQNRVFERYASAHGLLFVDQAAVYPKDPQFFLDPIHFNPRGTRVQAWGVLNALLPRIRERLASGAWPRADLVPLAEHPNIRPPQTYDGCADFLARRSVGQAGQR